MHLYAITILLTAREFTIEINATTRGGGGGGGAPIALVNLNSLKDLSQVGAILDAGLKTFDETMVSGKYQCLLCRNFFLSLRAIAL